MSHKVGAVLTQGVVERGFELRLPRPGNPTWTSRRFTHHLPGRVRPLPSSDCGRWFSAGGDPLRVASRSSRLHVLRHAVEPPGGGRYGQHMGDIRAGGGCGRGHLLAKDHIRAAPVRRSTPTRANDRIRGHARRLEVFVGFVLGLEGNGPSRPIGAGWSAPTELSITEALHARLLRQIDQAFCARHGPPCPSSPAPSTRRNRPQGPPRPFPSQTAGLQVGEVAVAATRTPFGRALVSELSADKRRRPVALVDQLLARGGGPSCRFAPATRMFIASWFNPSCWLER